MVSKVRPEKAKVEITEQFARAKRTLLWYSAAAIIVALSLESRGTLQPLLGIEIDKAVLAGMLFGSCLYYGIQWAADSREQLMLLNSYKQSVESEQLRNLHDEMIRTADELKLPMAELQKQFDQANRKTGKEFPSIIQEDIANSLDGYVNGLVYYANELTELTRSLNSVNRAAQNAIGEEARDFKASFDEMAIALAQDLVSNFNRLEGLSSGLGNEERALRHIFRSKGMETAVATSVKNLMKPQFDQLERTLEVVSTQVHEFGAPLRKFSDFEKALSRFDVARFVIMDILVPGALMTIALLLNWRQLMPLLAELQKAICQ